MAIHVHFAPRKTRDAKIVSTRRHTTHDCGCGKAKDARPHKFKSRDDKSGHCAICGRSLDHATHRG